MLIKSARLWLFSSTGRVWLRPMGFAGPKSRKSHSLASLIHHSRNLKINKFHMGIRKTGQNAFCPYWCSTGRVCLRPTAFAGPKSRKSHSLASLIHHSRNLKINKFHMGIRKTGQNAFCPYWCSTGRVCLRPTAFAGPKSLKSDHQTYFNLKLAKINKFHMEMGNTGRVCLRASQGHK